MKKLHYGLELFQMDGMPDWVKAIAIDEDGLTLMYSSSNLENVGRDSWVFNDNCDNNKNKYKEFHLEHDYEGDWKDSLLIRPEIIKVGDFVKMWPEDSLECGNESKCATYGFVTDITYDDKPLYKINNYLAGFNVRKFDIKKEKSND